MNTAELQRQLTIAYYNLRIGLLGLMMRLEDAGPITNEWKQMACRQGWYIQQRNKLRLQKRQG